MAPLLLSLFSEINFADPAVSAEIIDINLLSEINLCDWPNACA